MKHVRKALAFVVALVMAFAVVTPALAADNGKITVDNSAKGETYTIYKLFDAKVSDDGKSIAYTGDVPNDLSAYFTKNQQGNIVPNEDAMYEENGNVDSTKLNDTAAAAIKAWTATTDGQGKKIDSKPGNGGALEFTGLDYGYYVVTTTQGDQLVSVDSTKPNANIIDKNTTTPINNPKKRITKVENTTVTDEDGNAVVDANIGDTLTYTVSFGTASYNGTNQILEYIISDNFVADGVLSDVNVKSITVGDANVTKQFDDNGKISIPWVDANGKSLYPNNAVVTITYTAKVASAAAIDGRGNKNTATIGYVDEPNGTPHEQTVDKTFYTYALAIKKVDQSGQALKGAKFTIATEAGTPVKVTDDGNGVYTVGGTGTEVVSPESGLIIIKGVKAGKYILTETDAPKGYNKLTAPVEVTATKTGQTTTSTTTYFDKEGNKVGQHVENGFDVLVDIPSLSAASVVVVNKTGTEMPSTGGIGTTIFYIVGGVMVAGAVVFLLTKRRAAAE